MSLSLAWQPAQNLLAAHADNVTSSLATQPFAVGPGALLILVILGSLLLVAIGQVMTVVWRVVREALPILTVLLLALAVVAAVGAAALANSNRTPSTPSPTTSPSPAPRTAGPPRPSKPTPSAATLGARPNR